MNDNYAVIIMLTSSGANEFSSDRRVVDFPRAQVNWCTTKELNKLWTFSAIVFGYDLAISHTKL